MRTTSNLPILGPSTDPWTSGPRRPVWEAETGLQTRTSHNPHELRQLRTVPPGPPGGRDTPSRASVRSSSLPSASSDWHQQHPLSSAVSLPLSLSLLPGSLLFVVALPTRLNQATNPQSVSDGQAHSKRPDRKIPAGALFPGWPRASAAGPKHG